MPIIYDIVMIYHNHITFYSFDLFDLMMYYTLFFYLEIITNDILLSFLSIFILTII
jgi:hypothetical protein